MTLRTDLSASVHDHGDLLRGRGCIQDASRRGNLQLEGGSARLYRLCAFGDPVMKNSKVFEYRFNRNPPWCGIRPSGFRRIMLSRAPGLIRRPATSRERIEKSWSGRYPRRLSRNPPLPVGVPWQFRVATGLAERGNHVTPEANPSRLVHRHHLDRRARLEAALGATIVAVPLPFGITRPFDVTTATDGFELTHSTARVWSCTIPSEPRSVATSWAGAVGERGARRQDRKHALSVLGLLHFTRSPNFRQRGYPCQTGRKKRHNR